MTPGGAALRRRGPFGERPQTLNQNCPCGQLWKLPLKTRSTASYLMAPGYSAFTGICMEANTNATKQNLGDSDKPNDTTADRTTLPSVEGDHLDR